MGLLKIQNLEVSVCTPSIRYPVVRDVSMAVDRGEVLGVVGESGSGKSLTAYSILQLLSKPTVITNGIIEFNGVNLIGLPSAQMRALRGSKIAMIFQDPMMSLNPVLTIATQMVEAVQAHKNVSAKEARSRAMEALATVGIPRPAERLHSYPHEFSGGMRQRVAIAIALLHEPDIIIADEATTALDVTVQAQILYQLQKLVAERNIGMIWISHDLSVVSNIADRVAVMYAGEVVEQGRIADVVTRPAHPYTAGLIASVPSNNARGQRLRQIPGMAPRMPLELSGCPFKPRCEKAMDECSSPPPETLSSDGRRFRCFHPC